VVKLQPARVNFNRGNGVTWHSFILSFGLV
jgi:hypothetical protein